ncbi:hypothetical protein RA307_11770 [Xanthobacteraceae bacterium Astr-EGSB]|uniref:hypothetical protein n=1 Tax=Astrobacterium formosum TaxID=3069710 RepID=UPI0027B52153|nr:hypothetical protein [Xanthobacteraceae bacterium Astr-EGSB]
MRSGFDAFRLSIREWGEATRKWQCRLSAAQARRLGAPPGWRCSHVKFEIAEVSFDQLEPRRAALVSTVPTRFNLPVEQVDLVIETGTDPILAHPIFRERMALAR